MNTKLAVQRQDIIDFDKDSSKVQIEYFHPAYYPGPKEDTLQNFKKNLKTQPLDWYYNTNSVRYTLNGQNYRCKPFNEINWNDSIVIFGCSVVFGDGMDDADTLSNRLQELVGCDVVNLGACGSCQTTSLYNMTRLREKNIKPRAIIHVWTESTRSLHINNNFRLCGVGHWNNWGLDSDVQFNLLADSKTHVVSSMYNRMIANLIYSDIPVIHATSFPQMWHEQNNKYPDYPMLYMAWGTDKARDLWHPGIKTNIHHAKLLHEELINSGFSK
jgi:hypothetical protein